MNTATVASDPPSSISEVLSFVHDLRNPLAAIHVSAELLIRSSAAQPQVHRLARNMYRASLRMRELLEQCLDRDRCADRDFEVSDLRDVVADAVEQVAASAELQSVGILQNIPDGVFLPMDRHRIDRVLVNLLANALEVMPNGGTIHVSALSGRRSVWIRVRDTGPGIAPEIRDRLFQPYATAGKPNGLGLGLAASRQAVVDHGGDMWAESPRRGACFMMRLPRTIVKRRTALR